jgi:flagellar hook-basal body complex protein FliE
MSDIDISRMLSELRSTAAVAQGRAAQPTGANAPDFLGMMKNAVNSVNDSQQRAAALAESFELGNPKTSLAEVMLSLQKANISFQAMSQVRNKLVAAYQEIMNMQV